MDPETQRVRHHLEGALDALSLRDVRTLSPAQREARSRAAEALGRYVRDERYPRNRVRPFRTPVFVDEDGNRCAVAFLLEETGERALVAHIAGSRNLARVHELADEPALVAWLDAQGLTLDEAARIQPAYADHEEIQWQPTAAVLASADVGARAGAFDAVLAPGVRLGVRRFVRHQNSGGSMDYASLALQAEYRADFALGVGLGHRLSLLAQWEPPLGTSDAQWYLLAGPHAYVDGGLGGQLAAGFSFRRRPLPWLFELGADVTAFASTVALHLGLRVGMAY